MIPPGLPALEAAARDEGRIVLEARPCRAIVVGTGGGGALRERERKTARSYFLSISSRSTLPSRTWRMRCAFMAMSCSCVTSNTVVLVTHEHDIAMNAHRILHVRDGKVERDEILRK